MRIYAEFDNYKRRTNKERIELFQTAGKDVILSLLPVLDDFERAKKAADSTSDVDAVKEGIDLIYTKFTQLLASKGLKSVSAIGEEFNVDKHDALTKIPVDDKKKKGLVIDEVEKGYELNGQVIRFAKVVVGE
jgi:molecular chaperone GrpE